MGNLNGNPSGCPNAVLTAIAAYADAENGRSFAFPLLGVDSFRSRALGGWLSVESYIICGPS
jgi:hypothetical protein